MRILVAMADPAAAESLAKLFVEIGWPEPSIASTSISALECVERFGGCDILLVDTHLTPIDGFTLRNQIRSSVPTLRAIMTSPIGTSLNLEQLGGDPFLPTPFTPSELSDCLHQLISIQPQTPPASISEEPESPDPVKEPEPPESLLGATLANYSIESVVGESAWETLYRSTQTNVGRNAILHILKPEFASDSSAVTAFQHRASLKATFEHPKIASIFEGGEIAGFHFFSMEDVPLPSLESRIRSEKHIPALGAMEILALVADVHIQLAKAGVGSEPVDAKDIFFKRGKPPRLANIAAPLLDPPRPPGIDMACLAEILLKCLDSTPASASARKTLERLANAAEEPLAWEEVAELARQSLSKASQSTTTAPAPVSRDSLPIPKFPKRTLLWMVATVALVLPVAGYLIFGSMNRNSLPTIEDLDAMVSIPKGRFVYQGTPLELPEFLISKYEVTIGQYADFLDYLEKNPDMATSFDHPDQPRGKSHVPENWADADDVNPPLPGYYNRVKRWGQYQGVQLTIDSPVFGVDWFDAYAYAKWKGQRLPTEQEWERAALGPNGSPFPWGKAANPKRANTGADFTPNPDPKVGGDIDGFKRWSPVDQPSTDRSDAGVLGTAGNVSEWTASRHEFPNGEKNPVIRGGNWKNSSPVTGKMRITRLKDTHTDEALGFRTAKDPSNTP